MRPNYPLESTVSIRLAVLTLLIFATPFQASANDSSLDELIVTSSKTERYLKEVPVRTEVITRSEIEKKHALSLADALRDVPGLLLRDIHGKQGLGVWMQGFDSNRVLILINGNPVPASTGSTTDITQISVSDIERIEIIKGAASALYGTSAMGGVINVITRKTPSGTHASVDLQSGSWQEQNLGDETLAKHAMQANISAKSGLWSSQFNLQHENSSGWSVDHNTPATEGEKGVRQTLSASITHQLSPKTTIAVQPRYYHEDFLTVLDNFVPGIGNQPKDRTESTHSYQLGATIKHQVGPDQKWQARFMTESYENEARQDTQASAFVDQKRVTDIQQSQLAFDYSYHLNDAHTLTAGLEVKQQALDVNQFKHEKGWIVEVDNEASLSQEAFIQDSWFLEDNWELLPGLRVHHDSDFGTHASPMLSSLWSLETANSGRINIRGSLGQGYRVPNLKERHYIFDHSHLGYIVYGTPSLQPESSTSYQIGSEWYPNKSTMLQVHFFHNDAVDLIESALDPAESKRTGLAVYRYQNFESVRTQGFEIGYEDDLTHWLSINTHYARLEAIDETTGLYMVKRPQHEFKVGMDIEVQPTLQLSAFWRHESEQFIDAENLKTSPAFSVIDLKLNHQLSSNWKWYAGIDNLTDEQRKFDGADYRPKEGRYLYAGIRWNLNRPEGH